MDHGRLSGTYNWEDFFLDVGGERDEAEEERQIDLCITDAASVSRAIARSRSREGGGRGRRRGHFDVRKRRGGRWKWSAWRVSWWLKKSEREIKERERDRERIPVKLLFLGYSIGVCC